MANKYLIKFCDRETGQLLVPFGHIDNLIMPSVKQSYQTIYTLGSKSPMYIPDRTEMTPFSATYVNFENNEGGYFFWRYFSLETKLTRLCGSVFVSEEMKMLAYFDDAFVISTELKHGLDYNPALHFSLQVNDWEYVD